MSHAHGQVIKDGAVVGYYEYNGTVDVALTAIQGSVEDVKVNWRSSGANRDCICNLPDEEVILWSSYGGEPGFWWSGRACIRCMAITGGYAPGGFGGEDPLPVDGYPVRLA